MAAEHCRRDGCDGTLVDGYCDVCGMASRPEPLPSPRSPAAAPSPGVSVPGAATTSVAAPVAGSVRTPSTVTTSTVTSSTVTGSTTARSGLGQGLVAMPEIVRGDPAAAVLADAAVPEKDRYCGRCGAQVGRGRDGKPGRSQGFCTACRHSFDFSPKLAAGEVVGGQYEVVGCLAHGGLGWIYLGRDRNVSNRWVVLKGVLDVGSEDARAAASAERQFLAAMEHAEIVKIYNFVVHRGAEYIVMEYVDGKSLKSILKERRAANAGVTDPLPVEQAIAYVLGILPAFAYLHEHGYVYCDFKPDNVIHLGHQLKLIDLGGVRRLDDPAGNVYGTVGFQAPEIATVGPTVASDVYTIGRTLAVLLLDFKGYTTDYQHALPPVDQHPLLAEFDSLHRLLARATALDATHRFANVDELGDQLAGVLREVVAVRTARPRPAASTNFSGDVLAYLGSDLIEPPGERHLPAPLVALGDPAASFLVNLIADHAQVADILDAAIASGQIQDTVEARLRRVRAALDSGDHDGAISALAATAELSPGDWRIPWYQGLLELASGRSGVDSMLQVRSWLPGELAPQLGLALALERVERFGEAAALYERVLAVDPSYAFGAFRLGACYLRLGDRAAAVTALERVPATSVLHDDAGVASVDALLAVGQAMPSIVDVTSAAAIVDRVAIDSRRRSLLARDVLVRALESLDAGNDGTGHHVFGEPMQQVALRKRLEAVCRDLARNAPDRAERVRLVDEANRVRARTWW